MAKPIIELKDFSYRYTHDGPLVLKNINFTINEGDFVGVVGCNRAGKSTLCKSIVGRMGWRGLDRWEKSQ